MYYIFPFKGKKIDYKIIKANFLLLLTAAIWGFAFVAQRAGMAHIQPFIFNAVRFSLGFLSLLPWVIIKSDVSNYAFSEKTRISLKMVIGGGVATGTVLFLGSSLQQIGIVYTTAGNAGFITGLYVILVPLMGTVWGQKSETGSWIGSFLAVIGLYLLTVTEKFHISKGDFLVFLSAFFWAAHVHLISWFSRKIQPLVLAFLQFFFCAALSYICAFLFENIQMKGIQAAVIPILYTGLFSVGIAYTLQVFGQKHAPPTNAAIILSLEAVFAVLGGWMILGEVLSIRGYIGCLFLLLGMIFSQIGNIFRS
jgi:drug/metabolite transporter (DMT)-like permease